MRGFIDANPQKRHTRLLDLARCRSGDEYLATVEPSSVELANGIGSAGVMDMRKQVYADAVARVSLATGGASAAARSPVATRSTSSW